MKERCTSPFKVECQRKQDRCWVEKNLTTLSFWGCYHILSIGDSLCIVGELQIDVQDVAFVCS